MKKRILSLALALVMTFSLVACGAKKETPAPADSGTSSSEAPAETIHIKMATQHTEDYPSTKAIYYLADLLEERSGGVIKADIYTNSSLGGELDILDQCQVGTCDVMYCSPVAASMEPRINVFDLPFQFASYEEVEKVVSNDELMEEILGGFRNFGLEPIGAYENGLRVTSTNKRIDSLADMKNLKMRVPQAPISIAIFNALGTNATPIAFNELYSALQQGVVDGQENGYPTFATNKYYEVNKYIAETYHMWSINCLFFSQKFLDKLTPELQEMAIQAGKESCEYQRKLYREMEGQCKQEAIDNGVTVTYPDMAEWKEATASVYEDFYAQYPEWGKDLVDKIAAVAKS